MQPDLFRTGPADLSLTPEPGRNEPRLWVKRLVIWRDRDEVLRDIPLRPGLNVIWSPDAATDGTSIGHGGGKTTFCRLLRYCLGEESFATDEQQRATFDKMPKGGVGAEIRLDGQDWAVIRNFSRFNEDWAVANASLDEALTSSQPTGVEAFRLAASKTLLGGAAQLMPRSIGEAAAWPAVLAWLTRDQECRFSHLLDWRDKDSDSRSPVRKRSVEDRLTVVRAVLGALRPEELTSEAAKDVQAEAVKSLGANLGRLEWRAGEWRRELAKELGFDEAQPMSELDAATLARSAETLLAKALGVATEANSAAIQAARVEQDRLAGAVRLAERAWEEARIRAEEKEHGVKLRLDELPELSARAQTISLCPVCRVPTDRARAEGCGISLEQCDTEALQAQFAKAKKEYESERDEGVRLRNSLPTLRSVLAVAEQQHRQQRVILDDLIRAALSRETGVRRAQKLVEDAHRYAGLLSANDAGAAAVEKAEIEFERLRDIVASHRAGVADLVRALSECCDLVARYMIPGDVAARITLDGNGLHLHIDKGGDCTTAAIDSLKVVIFDLAVLTLGIEGKTRFPGFLVHDSPREADLDLTVYHRLFEFAQDLEKFGLGPLFQYIVTTTTTPPDGVVNGEWLRLTLHGAPSSARLLGIDL